jgi:acetyl esterase/lipase
MSHVGKSFFCSRLNCVALIWLAICLGVPALVAAEPPQETKPPAESLSATNANDQQPQVAEEVSRPTSLPAKRFSGEVYSRQEGVELLADVWVPSSSERMPVVLLIHGGAWTTGARWQMALHADSLVRAGYAAVSIDYRLAPRWKFPAQLDDCRQAWRWMYEQADRFGWDRQRMAVYGYSAGAHLALLVAMSEDPAAPGVPRPKAVVAGGAPCSLDWFAEDSRALAYFLGGSRRQLPQLYRNASPLYHVSPDDPPVLLVHGGRDTLVPIENARRFLEHCKQVGVSCDLAVFDQLGHVATFLSPQMPQRAIEFLNKHLAPQNSTTQNSTPQNTTPQSAKAQNGESP